MHAHESLHAPRLADPAQVVARPSLLSSIAAAWILSLGFDLFLHGGILASLYTASSSFLLPPEEAFRRIPLGYLAFLVLTVSLAWLFRRLDISGALRGLGFGSASGAIVWGALVVGLYSITTATVPLLTGWWIGQSVELGLAGAVLGAAANGVSQKRIWTVVGIAVFIFLALTITLQSIGLAPAVKSAN